MAVALRAAATATPPRAWSEPDREIPLGPFVVFGAAVGAAFAVRSVTQVLKNSSDAAMMAPVVVVIYVGRGLVVGALGGLTVGAIVRELVR